VISKRFLIILVVSILFASTVLALDISNYEPYEIPRHLHGVAGTGDDGNIYVVYQDYQNLYSSVGLITWNPENKTTDAQLIVKDGWDNIKPKIFNIEEGLLVAWVEYSKDRNKFAYGIYNPSTESIEDKFRFDVDVVRYNFDFSFDGRNLTLATSKGGEIKYWRIDINNNELLHQGSIPHTGNQANVATSVTSIFYIAKEGDEGVLYRFDYENMTSEYIENTSSDIYGLAAYEDHVTWMERTAGEISENWGRLYYNNGNTTIAQTLEYPANLPGLIEYNDKIYITWAEELPDPADPDDEHYETRVAIIHNTTDPAFNIIGEPCQVDGRFSANQFFVVSDDGLWIFWLDMIEEYSLWGAEVRESGFGADHMIIYDGEMGFLLTMIITMGLIMGTMLGFLFSLKSFAKKDAKKPGDTETKTTTTRGKKFDVPLLVYNRKEAYFFLKFYFAVIPFLFLIGLFYNLMGDEGYILGYRIGFGNIINNCIVIVVASIALFMLKTEAHASTEHRVGYGFLQAALGLAVGGLFWYEVYKEIYNPYTIYIVYGSSLLATLFSLIGPMIMLAALTKKKQFYIPAIPLFVIIGLTLVDFSRYSSLEFFPSVSAPLRLLTSNSFMLHMMIMMVTGILMGMILFDILTFEKLKSIKEWTKQDVDSIKKRAMAMSLTGAGTIAAFTLSFAMMMPIPDFTFILENTLFLFLTVAMTVMIFAMVRSMYDNEQFLNKFKESPSSAIYMIFMMPVMTVILMLIFALFLGLFSLIVLVLYGYSMYKSNNMLDALYQVGLKDAVEEEITPEEEKLEQVTRADIGMLVKRNLKIHLAIPPVAAMIFLLFWKMNFVLPQFRGFLPENNIWVDIGALVLGALVFIELKTAKSKLDGADNVMTLVSLSSGGGGFVLFILVVLFYTLSGGNVYVIIGLIAMFQVEVLLYFQIIYPGLLKRLNSETKSFFMVSEANRVYITNLKKADKELYTLPEEIKVSPKAMATGMAQPGVASAARVPLAVTAAGGTEGDGTTTAKSAAPEGKGKFIAQETESALQFRINDTKKKAMMLALLGLGLLASPVPLILLNAMDFMCLIITGTMAILGIIFLPLSLYVMGQADKAKPIKIYENGLEITDPAGEVTYYPFAGYLSCSTTYTGGRKTVTLQGTAVMHSFEVWPEIEELVSDLPTRVGLDLTKAPKLPEAQIKRMNTLRKFSIPISVIGSLIVIIVTVAINRDFIDPLAFAVLSFPVMTMFIFTYMTIRQRTWTKGLEDKYRIKKQVVYGLIAICIAISVTGAAMFSQTNILGLGTDLTLYKEDPADIFGEVVWNNDKINETIYLDSWLFIEGNVRINNCTIVFNCTSLGQYGLIIIKNSEVEITNSEIRAPTPDHGFKFEIYGHTVMKDSMVRNVFGIMDRMNGDGGMEVYADSEISNTIIDGSLTNGLMVGNCLVTVTDCLVQNTEDEGIEVSGKKGKLIMDNTKLENCSWGIHVLGSGKAVITNSELINCDHALTLTGGAEVEISDSTISGSNTLAVQVNPGTTLKENNLVLENNAQNYDQPLFDYYSVCCVTMPVVITIILSAGVLIFNKRYNEFR
jgi:hypothetical protein